MAVAKPTRTVPVDIRTTREGTLLLDIPSALWPPPTRDGEGEATAAH